MKAVFRLMAAGCAALAVAGCSVDMGGFAFVNENTVSARVATTPPVLNPDGSCSSADLEVSPRASAISLGIGECDLVRLKGAAPTDVLIGESGRGQREVQVLYSEPGGRELYLFSDNKLIRIVRPGQG